MPTMLLGYQYKGEPTPEQATFHNKNMGCVRKYWNLALADYQNDKTIHTPASYKDDYSYLKEVDSLALANAQMHLKQTINSHKKGICGEPNFKKKRYEESYTTNNQKGTIYIENGRFLHLPKMKESIKLKMHRPLPGAIHSVTVTRTNVGEYIYTILCEVETSELAKTKKSVGIDLGLKSFVTDSNGVTAETVRAYRDHEAKLAKEQHKLSRMFESNVDHRVYDAKGNVKQIVYKRPLSECRNYQKQRIKVAKIHQKIANIRKDMLHKLSKAYVFENDVICLENLYVVGMKKNRHLAKAISDSGWGMFSRMLEYKSQKYGREFVKVGRYYPSTQTCSKCGYRRVGDKKLTLKEREWICPECGEHHDRDVNAAINIRNEGLRLLEEQREAISVS